MSNIFFIRDVSGSADSKTEIWRIYIIRMLSRRSSLYVINLKTFTILNNSSFIKSSLLLSFIV